MKKQDGWYVRRPYKHFDLPLDFPEAQRLVTTPQRVAAHSFYPFLAYSKGERQLKKVHTRHARHTKMRPIRYAAHIDGYIFSYYAKTLSEKYEERLCQLGLQQCVIAYRQNNGSNIEFARDAFNEIERRKNCVAITLDISSFFDSMDHALLKRQWCDLIGQNPLPVDHYKVFRAITNYSYAERDACYAALAISEDNVPHRLVKNAAEYRNKIRGNKLVNTNIGAFGIPQGSPISALLSNIYMLSFDQKMQRMVDNIGGYYRRYSDDIILICPVQNKDDLLTFVRNAISQMGDKIRINDDKTTITLFACDNDGMLYSKGDRLQYLGFEFDGQRKLIKAATLSRYWRKVTYNVRSAKRKAIKAAKTGGNPKIFRRKLYRKFSHLGKSNFIRYAYRADGIINGRSIKRQVKRHWNRLASEISKPLNAPWQKG